MPSNEVDYMTPLSQRKVRSVAELLADRYLRKNPHCPYTRKALIDAAKVHLVCMSLKEKEQGTVEFIEYVDVELIEYVAQ